MIGTPSIHANMLLRGRAAERASSHLPRFIAPLWAKMSPPRRRPLTAAAPSVVSSQRRWYRAFFSSKAPWPPPHRDLRPQGTGPLYLRIATVVERMNERAMPNTRGRARTHTEVTPSNPRLVPHNCPPAALAPLKSASRCRAARRDHTPRELGTLGLCEGHGGPLHSAGDLGPSRRPCGGRQSTGVQRTARRIG